MKKKPQKPSALALLRKLDAASKKKQTFICLVDVFARFVELRGGEEGVAKMLSAEYDASPPGSMARTRILGMLLQAWKSMRGGDKTEESGLLSDQDLNRELEKVIRDNAGAS